MAEPNGHYNTVIAETIATIRRHKELRRESSVDKFIFDSPDAA